MRVHDKCFCKAHGRDYRACAAEKPCAVMSLEGYQDGFVLEHDCGNMDNRCNHCGSLNFPNEQVGQPPHFALCCRNGKLKHLPPAQPAPPELRELLTSPSRAARDFRGNIRVYNSALAFVSFGLNCFDNVVGRGPPIVKCHGSVYHVAGRLFPEEPQEAKYAELYLYDHGEALGMRRQRHGDQQGCQVRMQE